MTLYQQVDSYLEWVGKSGFQLGQSWQQLDACDVESSSMYMCEKEILFV